MAHYCEGIEQALGVAVAAAESAGFLAELVQLVVGSPEGPVSAMAAVARHARGQPGAAGLVLALRAHAVPEVAPPEPVPVVEGERLQQLLLTLELQEADPGADLLALLADLDGREVPGGDRGAVG